MALDNTTLSPPTIPTGTLTPGLGLPSLDDILASLSGAAGNTSGALQIPGAAGGKAVDPKIQTLLSLLGLGSQFGAAAIQQGNTGSAANYLKDIGQTSRDRSTAGFDQAGNAYGNQNSGLGGILSGTDPWSQIISQGFMGNVGSLNNLLPYLIQSGQNLPEFQGLANNLLYQDPNMVAQTRGITDLTSNTSGMLAKAAQLLNSGGVTDTQQPLNNFAQMLMSGLSPNQQALQGAGTSILGTGGLTPELQQALQQASGVVQNQGQTELTNKLAQTGLDLASQNPLLSGAQAASIAEDQSGRQYANAAKNARENANLRGQGPGSVVANGAGNQSLADASDTALAGIAKSSNDARLGQQGLGLSQQQQGLNTALGAGGLQQGLELGGLGAIGNLTNASTGRLGTGGALTNDAAQLQNAGGNFYNALLGLQQGNMAQGFQAGNQNVQSQAQLLQQALSDIMQGRTGAAGIGSDLAKQYGTNTDRILAGGQTGMQDLLAALAQYGQQGSSYLNSGNSALNTYGNTGGAFSQLMQQPNSYSVILNNLGAGLAQPSTGSKVANTAATGIGSAIGAGLGTILKGQGGSGLNIGFDNLTSFDPFGFEQYNAGYGGPQLDRYLGWGSQFEQ